MTYDGELDSVVDEARERIRNEREALAEFAQPEPPLCERCLQPSYAALCVQCDPDRWGLFEENRDIWST